MKNYYTECLIRNSLSDIGGKILPNIIKCFLYPDHEDFEKWCDEIYSAFQWVGNFNTDPSSNYEDFIYGELVTNSFMHMKNWLDYVQKNYGEAKFSYNGLNLVIKEYLHWLSNHLSSGVHMSKSISKKKIEFLISKYGSR